MLSITENSFYEERFKKIIIVVSNSTVKLLTHLIKKIKGIRKCQIKVFKRYVFHIKAIFR